MIDWRSVLGHATWITGLALVLSAMSFHWWLAGAAGRRLDAIGQPAFRVPVLAGMSMVCAGWAVASARGLPQTAIWLALGAALALLAVRARR